jgi:hypothetical protein
MVKMTQLKRRIKMGLDVRIKSQTQQVIDYLTENNFNQFFIKDMWEAFPNIKHNTMSTLVSRDLKKKGFVTRTDERKGMNVLYQFHSKPFKSPIILALEDDIKNLQTKAKPDSYDSYVKIGKGIEQLLEVKNDSIKGLENQLKASKKMIMDCEATVQDRDRHIVEQGNKIHELSEKLRNKSGGPIKLDELQNLVNG